jgi:predicted CoA-binding protein
MTDIFVNSGASGKADKTSGRIIGASDTTKGERMLQLDAIFSPQSVAVVVTSTTHGKVGHDIFVNILQGDYRGTLYPVNPRARYVKSVRAYPSISETKLKRDNVSTIP